MSAHHTVQVQLGMVLVCVPWLVSEFVGQYIEQSRSRSVRHI